MKRVVGIIGLVSIFMVGSVGGGIVGASLATRRDASLAKMVQEATKRSNGEGVQKKIEIPQESAAAIARAEESATIAVVKSAAPAVVSIRISKEVAMNQTAFNPFQDFDQFFGLGLPQPTPKTEQKNQQPKQKRIVGGGSGFIVKSDGMIVTNKHVASDENASYTVITQDGKEYEAKVLARDPVADVAVLKIEATGLPTLGFGDSDKIEIGETVIAIGNALAELQNTVTKGVISGINRRVHAGSSQGMSEVIEEALQTDAAINPGNSGGPLLNLEGKVIGVNTAVDQGGQSIGFSIPSNVVKRIADSVEKNGRIVRPWIGVRYVLLEDRPDVAKALGINKGALILSSTNNQPAIIPGSPADKAGLKERDVIIKVNAAEVSIDHSLSGILGKFQPGDSVNLTVRRDGKEISLPLTLSEYDEVAVSKAMGKKVGK